MLCKDIQDLFAWLDALLLRMVIQSEISHRTIEYSWFIIRDANISGGCLSFTTDHKSIFFFFLCSSLVQVIIQWF